MSTPKLKAVLYLDRNRLDFYLHNSSSVASCNLPTTCVYDLDIKNEEELNKIISQFITQNKLSPAYFLTVFSHNVLFEKDISGLSGAQADATVTDFVDNVPFENVISKTLRFGNGVRVVATNRDFYETIKATLERNGFLADGAIADSSLGPELSQSSALEINMAKAIMQKFDSLKTQSLVNPGYQRSPEFEQAIENNQPPPKPKSLLPLLLIILGGLIIVLVTVIFMQFR